MLYRMGVVFHITAGNREVCCRCAAFHLQLFRSVWLLLVVALLTTIFRTFQLSQNAEVSCFVDSFFNELLLSALTSRQINCVSLF